MVLPPSATIRTAIELKNAIDSAAKHLEPIGFCPTLCDRWKGDSYDHITKPDQKKVNYKALMKELRQIQKQFRLSGNVERPTKSATQAKIKAVLGKMPLKYGLLLERQYCKGTTQLSGFDAQLLAAAKALTGVDTYITPVLTKFDGTKFDGPYYDDGTVNDRCQANVFPLMEPHIDALVRLHTSSPSESISEDEDETDDEDDDDDDDDDDKESNEDEDKRSHKKKEPLELSLKGTEAAWIKERNVSKVPFYSLDLVNSLVIWRRTKMDSSDFDGRMPTTEDSIFLSYAMVVLPKNHKRKRGDNE